ncbi:hypothetical protein GHU05_06670 [Fructobacillus tropaeoli]|uniref:hypothetical protein n=1 Tax=Fructobacillus tropaeoli TaxID=709323 RepID=UPI001455F983|nr:hypothetical protein [Fructobacillus tropaeoli]NLS38603.1 hypothetical protein [Fructobacillus tropaeoli]
MNNEIAKEILNVLYHEQKLDPAEFTENYADRNNLKAQEIVSSKFPQASDSDKKEAWDLFYNMPPHDVND